jgi:hypothetical protein
VTEAQFSGRNKGIIIFKSCSMKGYFQFTKQVVITGCHIGAVRMEWQCCLSKFSDLILGFLTGIVMQQQNILFLPMQSNMTQSSLTFL